MPGLALTLDLAGRVADVLALSIAVGGFLGLVWIVARDLWR